jgi:uncharacterized membrane protein
MDHDDQEMGPIQIMVFALDEPELDSTILDQIAALEDEGIALLLDAAVVVRESEDEFATYDLEAAGFEDRPLIGTLVGMVLGLTAADEVSGNGFASDLDLDLSESTVLTDLAAELQIGEAAGVLVFEQTWAAGLMGAIRDRGGYIIADGLVHPEDLIEPDEDG